MSTEPVHLFVNPIAGRGRARRRLNRIEELLLEAGLAVIVHLSRRSGDIERLVRTQIDEGVDKVIVAGGDGSIHEAVNGILGGDRDAALGVIPSGTGNDFAKACDIPLDYEHATRLLADRLIEGTQARRIDAGRMNERYFANGAGIGFDAKVTALARAFRWPIGDLVYLIAIFRGMVDGIATPDMTITTDGFDWEGPLTLVNVSNGPWIGGMFHIAPMANNADGQLEMLVAEPVTRRRIVALLPKLIGGTHMSEKEIAHAPVRKVRVTAAEPVPAHLDGEVQAEATEFEIEVLPERLRLL